MESGVRDFEIASDLGLLLTVGSRNVSASVQYNNLQIRQDASLIFSIYIECILAIYNEKKSSK
jgi:hypothetical protein